MIVLKMEHMSPIRVQPKLTRVLMIMPRAMEQFVTASKTTRGMVPDAVSESCSVCSLFYFIVQYA
jgi:hypothetical protein